MWIMQECVAEYRQVDNYKGSFYTPTVQCPLREYSWNTKKLGMQCLSQIWVKRVANFSSKSQWYDIYDAQTEIKRKQMSKPHIF